MKKIASIILTVCLIVTLGIATAQAGWYTCKLTGAGIGFGGATYVVVTDAATSPAFSNVWAILDPAYANQMLATALTAISNGTNAQMYFDTSGVPVDYVTVRTLYMVQ